MARRLNPGCLLRSSLAICGVVFLPIAIWFLHTGKWWQGISLIVVSVVFLRLAFTRNENSWISAVDDL
jgi:hypothetical protein